MELHHDYKWFKIRFKPPKDFIERFNLDENKEYPGPYMWALTDHGKLVYQQFCGDTEPPEWFDRDIEEHFFYGVNAHMDMHLNFSLEMFWEDLRYPPAYKEYFDMGFAPIFDETNKDLKPKDISTLQLYKLLLLGGK